MREVHRPNHGYNHEYDHGYDHGYGFEATRARVEAPSFRDTTGRALVP